MQAVDTRWRRLGRNVPSRAGSAPRNGEFAWHAPCSWRRARSRPPRRARAGWGVVIRVGSGAIARVNRCRSQAAPRPPLRTGGLPAAARGSHGSRAGVSHWVRPGPGSRGGALRAAPGLADLWSRDGTTRIRVVRRLGRRTLSGWLGALRHFRVAPDHEDKESGIAARHIFGWEDGSAGRGPRRQCAAGRPERRVSGKRSRLSAPVA